MTNILIIDSAVTGEASVSRKLTSRFAEDARRSNPSARIVYRDIGTKTIPHLTAETVGTIRGAPADAKAAKAALALADALTAEVKEADLIVIGAPMYNFGIASTLKTWFDHILRAGITFRYTEAGPEGLVTGKRAIVIETRAGLYSEGPTAAFDHQEPHLRTLLGFIGIVDVAFIRAEQLAFGPDTASAAIAQAAGALAGIAENKLVLAA